MASPLGSPPPVLGKHLLGPPANEEADVKRLRTSPSITLAQSIFPVASGVLGKHPLESTDPSQPMPLQKKPEISPVSSLLQQAQLCLSTRQLQQAFNLSAQALRLDPENPMAIKQLASACFFLGRYKDVEMLALRILKKTPQDAGAQRLMLSIRQYNNFRAAPQPPDLPDNPPLLTLKKEDEALTCFLLLFADFTGHDLGDLPVNVKISLSFLIKELTNINDNQPSPPLQSLIHLFEDSYRIACWQGVLRATSIPQGYRDLRTQCKEKMVALLKEKRTILIPSGYVKEGAGHCALIRLDLDNENKIKGDVINTGEGIEIFAEELCPQTGKTKVFCHLALPPISLEALRQSQFLDTLLNLQLLSIPNEDAGLNYPFSLDTKTHYSMADFNHVLLPLWPKIDGSILIPSKPYSSKEWHLFDETFYHCPQRDVGSGIRNANQSLPLSGSPRSIKRISLFIIATRLRMEESFRKGARRFAKLEQQKLLLPQLKAEFLTEFNSFINSLNRKAKEFSDLEKKPLQLSLPLKEVNPHKITLNKAASLEELAKKETLSYPLEQVLPSFSIEHIEDYLAKARQLIDTALENGQKIKAGS